MNEDRVKLDNTEITVEELQEKRNNLSPNERIVEVERGVYEPVRRLNG